MTLLREYLLRMKDEEKLPFIEDSDSLDEAGDLISFDSMNILRKILVRFCSLCYFFSSTESKNKQLYY